MNSKRIAFSTLLLAVILLPSLSFGQAQEGSIEASWNRATSAPAPSPRVEAVPRAVTPRSTAKDSEYPDAAWEKSRSAETRPWPQLSSRPTLKEYHDVNTAVIDSLAHLYCLSSNYISTLRIRNQQALQNIEPHLREFEYQGKPAASGQGQQSLHALHKELLHLLDRCLVGR
jgi:hypothetical protein